MRPSEVRSRVLSDHEVLRELLEQLEALAGEISRPEPDRDRVDRLRGEADAFLARLREHMRWEEAYLLPALREADAWGQERADRLIADHREQRELFDFILSRLHDRGRSDAMVAADVRALIGLLREDMEHEEAELLDERVLRDDVIGIEVETG
jgi:hemerythrin-like domain-containing protein